MALMVLLFGLSVLARAVCAAGTGLDLPLLLTQVPAEAKRAATNWNPHSLVRTDWFEGARVVVVSPDGQVKVLSEGFQSACDPSLSFDAKKFVFAAKKTAASSWRVYEVGVDGSGLRAVSAETQEARGPVYASVLFTLDSPEPWFTVEFSAREATLNEAGLPSAASLYNLSLDGKELRRVTYTPNNSFDPCQTSDGRIIFAMERYPTQPGASGGRVSLYSINMEGTDLEPYGAEQGNRVQQMPCPTDAGRVVFVESDAGSWDGAGQLACVQERRPHQSYQRLTRESGFAYLYPAALRDNSILVSRRASDGSGTCAVFRFDPRTSATALVFDSPGYHDVQARLVRPRQRPDGRSTTVTPKVNTGVFYAMDCYTADERMRKHLSPGIFKRVRIIEGVPQVVAGASTNYGAGAVETPAYLMDAARPRGGYVPRRLLGTTPIESDGSFNVEVPADVPLMFQPLDSRGLALENCAWVWVKPKENRGCIGCHEDPELIPENQYVLALRRPSDRVAPPPSERRTLGFKESIVPILKIRCASADCHGSASSPFHLPLNADRSSEQDLKYAYASLMRPLEGGTGPRSAIPQRGKYIDAGRARTSALVWQLFGADTSRPWDRAPGEPAPTSIKLRLMPPADKGGPLNEDEIRTLVEWIDVGAPWETVKMEEAVGTVR